MSERGILAAAFLMIVCFFLGEVQPLAGQTVYPQAAVQPQIIYQQPQVQVPAMPSYSAATADFQAAQAQASAPMTVNVYHRWVETPTCQQPCQQQYYYRPPCQQYYYQTPCQQYYYPSYQYQSPCSNGNYWHW